MTTVVHPDTVPWQGTRGIDGGREKRRLTE